MDQALDQAALGLTAVRELPPNMPQIETVLPEITNQELVSRNDEMRKLRYQAMKAAKVTTKYETPMTKIQRISLTVRLTFVFLPANLKISNFRQQQPNIRTACVL